MLSQRHFQVTALTGSQPCLLNVNHYLMLINMSLETIKMRFVANVHPCASVGLKPGRFGSGVEVQPMVHTLTLVNSWKYSQAIPCIQEVLLEMR